MMHQLVYYVIGAREEKDSLLAGAPKLFPADEQGRAPRIEVTDPLGRRVRTSSAAGEGEQGPGRFTRTFHRGVYRWRTVEGPEKSGAFVVNANTRESNLGALEQDAVKKLFGERPVYFAKDVTEMKQLAARLRKGVQLWNIVLFIVIAIAVAECFLANRSEAVRRSVQQSVPKAA
jgi:hypothetical protein